MTRPACQRTTVLIVLAALCLGAGAGRADERLLVDAQVKGKAVRFAFDTGASEFILFPKAVDRLGLRMTKPTPEGAPGAGDLPLGITGLSELTLGGNTIWTAFRVFNLPPYLDKDIDGVLGWRPLRANVFRIDAAALKAEMLADAPEDVTDWVRLGMRRNSTVLLLDAADGETNFFTFAVDTGSERGVVLPPKKWQAWKAANPRQPATLYASYMPGAGLVVREESLASKLSLGPLTLTDVTVMEANQVEATIGFDASLGLAALKQLDFILDGKKNVAYLRLKPGPRPAYQHNRLGAIFVPADLEKDDLIGQVVDGGPAFAAGIRTGDLLLKIGDLDATKWRTDPNVLPLTRFWEKPAGTRLELTVKRGNETLTKTAVLKDILTPEKKN
jgi:hypothetical protein